ncbi:Endothelin-converting enzyme 1 [Ceratocystis platani]|uniref:Endothelin-converting enzyme 1 n=1 Tax=Ceratocystis fimbriata f. sp. platani TaxID=88771 RepID=A0A0F8CW05_CERFI|nr:Endothelin-converting enzyme 1 [Ceratocystis platani]
MKFRAALLAACSATLGVRAETTVEPTADIPLPTGEVVCDTAECKSAAREILDRLSPNYLNMNACSDFDEMVCGGWRDKNYLQPDQHQLSTFLTLEEQVKASLRDTLEKQPYKDGRLSADTNFNKLKTSYEACMNTQRLTNLGLEPLRVLLEEVDRSQSINVYLKVLMSNGVATLLSLEPHPDFHNPGSHILGVLAPSSLGLPSKYYYSDEDIIAQYGDVVVHILATLYPDVKGTVSRKIIDLEIKLAEFMPDDDYNKKGVLEKNTMSLSDAAQVVPQIDLEELVRFFKPDGATVEYVAMHHLRYIQTLSEILENEPREVLQAYFRWQTIVSYADYVQDSVFNDFYRLQSTFFGLEFGLGWSLGNIFLYSSFPKNDERLGKKIVKDIKLQFQSKVWESTWMDDDAKIITALKIGRMDFDVGYPSTSEPDAQSADEVDMYYKDVYVRPDSYFENENFGAKIPAYISYGSVGFITAHEMGHAFGLLGRHYDHEFRFGSWWSEETLQGFNDKAQCFIDEYSKLTVPDYTGEDFHINGTSTLEENISDFYGFREFQQAFGCPVKESTCEI